MLVADDSVLAKQNGVLKKCLGANGWEVKPKVQHAQSWPRLYTTESHFLFKDDNSVMYAGLNGSEESKLVDVLFVKGDKTQQTKDSQISNEALHNYLKGKKEKSWELCDLSEGKEVKKKSPVNPVLVSSVNGGR
jgi:hypothetical protein